MLALADLWRDPAAQQRFARLAAKVEGFDGDLGPAGHSVPLRMAGGLHALVRAGRAPGLAAAYPPNPGPELITALAAALALQEADLCAFIDSPPQTNETGRSAVLIAAASEVVARAGLPLTLSELGASAGLNLNFDHYGLQIGGTVWGDATSPVILAPDWAGPLPPQVPLRVLARAGVDLNPLNAQRDGARLMAYVWPDQEARLARMAAALTLADPPPDQGDAADWLETRLKTPWHGQCHLVFHTVAHQYFPEKVQARIATALEAAGACATPDAPLAWVGMEGDGLPDGAAVTLRYWPGNLHLTLGRAGFHGQWGRWQPVV